MIFMYSQSFIRHFTGSLRTNEKTSFPILQILWTKKESHISDLFGCDIHGANVYLAIMSIQTSLISACSSHAVSVSLWTTGELDRLWIWGEGWFVEFPVRDLVVAREGLSGLGS